MGGCYGGEKIMLNFQEEITKKSEDKNENNNKNDENNSKNNIKNENSRDNKEDNNNIKDENYNNSNQNVMMGYDDKDGSLKRSRERGCGGASQVAIFKKIKGKGDFLFFYCFYLFLFYLALYKKKYFFQYGCQID